MTMTTNQQNFYFGPPSEDQTKALMGSLNRARVATRKQGGRDLSYLEAWDIRATLIRVFGYGGWSAEATELKIVRIENNVPKTTGYGKDKVEVPIEYDTDGQIKFGTANFRVTASTRMTLRIHQTDAVYSEYAASSQTGPDIGEVTDFAVKTAESDALKRAAMNLGTQFGLSLYDGGSLKDVVRMVFAPGQEKNVPWYESAETPNPQVQNAFGSGVPPQNDDERVAPAEASSDDVVDEAPMALS